MFQCCSKLVKCYLSVKQLDSRWDAEFSAGYKLFANGTLVVSSGLRVMSTYLHALVSQTNDHPASVNCHEWPVSLNGLFIFHYRLSQHHFWYRRAHFLSSKRSSAKCLVCYNFQGASESFKLVKILPNMLWYGWDVEVVQLPIIFVISFYSIVCYNSSYL